MGEAKFRSPIPSTFGVLILWDEDVHCRTAFSINQWLSQTLQFMAHYNDFLTVALPLQHYRSPTIIMNRKVPILVHNNAQVHSQRDSPKVKWIRLLSFDSSTKPNSWLSLQMLKSSTDKLFSSAFLTTPELQNSTLL